MGNLTDKQLAVAAKALRKELADKEALRGKGKIAGRRFC